MSDKTDPKDRSYVSQVLASYITLLINDEDAQSLIGDMNIELARSTVHKFRSTAVEQTRESLFNWLVMGYGLENAQKWIIPQLELAKKEERIGSESYQSLMEALTPLSFQSMEFQVQNMETEWTMIEAVRDNHLMSEAKAAQLISLLYPENEALKKIYRGRFLTMEGGVEIPAWIAARITFSLMIFSESGSKNGKMPQKNRTKIERIAKAARRLEAATGETPGSVQDRQAIQEVKKIEEEYGNYPDEIRRGIRTMLTNIDHPTVFLPDQDGIVWIQMPGNANTTFLHFAVMRFFTGPYALRTQFNQIIFEASIVGNQVAIKVVKSEAMSAISQATKVQDKAMSNFEDMRIPVQYKRWAKKGLSTVLVAGALVSNTFGQNISNTNGIKVQGQMTYLDKNVIYKGVSSIIEKTFLRYNKAIETKTLPDGIKEQEKEYFLPMMQEIFQQYAYDIPPFKELTDQPNPTIDFDSFIEKLGQWYKSQGGFLDIGTASTYINGTIRDSYIGIIADRSPLQTGKIPTSVEVIVGVENEHLMNFTSEKGQDWEGWIIPRKDGTETIVYSNDGVKTALEKIWTLAQKYAGETKEQLQSDIIAPKTPNDWFDRLRVVLLIRAFGDDLKKPMVVFVNLRTPDYRASVIKHEKGHEGKAITSLLTNVPPATLAKVEEIQAQLEVMKKFPDLGLEQALSWVYSSGEYQAAGQDILTNLVSVLEQHRSSLGIAEPQGEVNPERRAHYFLVQDTKLDEANTAKVILWLNEEEVQGIINANLNKKVSQAMTAQLPTPDEMQRMAHLIAAIQENGNETIISEYDMQLFISQVDNARDHNNQDQELNKKIERLILDTLDQLYQQIELKSLESLSMKEWEIEFKKKIKELKYITFDDFLFLNNILKRIIVEELGQKGPLYSSQRTYFLETHRRPLNGQVSLLSSIIQQTDQWAFHLLPGTILEDAYGVFWRISPTDQFLLELNEDGKVVNKPGRPRLTRLPLRTVSRTWHPTMAALRILSMSKVELIPALQQDRKSLVIQNNLKKLQPYNGKDFRGNFVIISNHQGEIRRISKLTQFYATQGISIHVNSNGKIILKSSNITDAIQAAIDIHNQNLSAAMLSIQKLFPLIRTSLMNLGDKKNPNDRSYNRQVLASYITLLINDEDANALIGEMNIELAKDTVSKFRSTADEQTRESLFGWLVMGYGLENAQQWIIPQLDLAKKEGRIDSGSYQLFRAALTPQSFKFTEHQVKNIQPEWSMIESVRDNHLMSQAKAAQFITLLYPKKKNIDRGRFLTMEGGVKIPAWIAARIIFYIMNIPENEPEIGKIMQENRAKIERIAKAARRLEAETGETVSPLVEQQAIKDVNDIEEILNNYPDEFRRQIRILLTKIDQPTVFFPDQDGFVWMQVGGNLNNLLVDLAVMRFFTGPYALRSQFEQITFEASIVGDKVNINEVKSEAMTTINKRIAKDQNPAFGPNSAMTAKASNWHKLEEDKLGGIDFNSANMNLQIRRDGRGVPLPLSQQDMAQLSLIQGFEPEIIDIKPAVNLPILSELRRKLQSTAV